MSDWYEQALANAKKKDAEKRKKEDALAKSPKYQNEQLKGQVYAGSTASNNKPKTEPKSAKEVLKTMAGDGKTTNKLDNKKKQQNKKAAAVGATSAAKSSSIKKTTGYKKSAVNTDTLKATKKIAESQEKKLPTKRNGSGKASVQKKETAKKTLQALKEVSKPTVKTAENYDPNPYTKEKIDAMFDQIATDDSLYGKFGRAYTGFSQGVIDAALGTANLVGSKLTGKDINLQERTGLNIDHEGLRNTKGFKGGQVAGEVAGYMMQGAAADPAIDALLAGTKLAKMSGKAGTAAKIFGRNAIESGTIGLAQNLGMAHQQGLEGMDFAKDVALNTALDFAAGSTLGGVAAGLAAKGAKKGDDVAKAVAKIEEAPADTPKVAVKAAEPVTEVAEEVVPKIEEVPVQASSTRSRDKLRTTTKPVPVEVTTTRKPPRTRNYSSNIEDLLAAEQEYDYAIEEAGRKIADYVRNYKGKGSLTTITPKFEDATGSGVRHTVSQNDPWYSEALKKYGSNKAVNNHADEIAADLLEGDLFRARGQQDFLDEDTYDYIKSLEEMIDTNNNIVDNLSNKLPRGVDGRKLSNPSTVELPKAEPQLKGTGGRTLKPGGADLAREAESIKDARKKYGTFEGSDVPKATELGDVQQGARTIRNSDILDEEAVNRLEEGIRQGDYWKTTITNKSALQKAQNSINKSLDDATSSFRSIMLDGRQAKSEDIARGYLLAQEYIKLKDYDMVENILADVSAMESEAGRTLQAMRIFSQLSPLGRMKGAKRTAEKLMAERGVDIKINQKLLDDIANAKTDAEIAKANEAFAVDVWNQVPATLSEKLNAWRYLAMLGNPKTHIRNFVGNLIGVPARQISNTLAAGMEKAFKKKINKLSDGNVSGSKAVFSKKYNELADQAYKKNKDALEAVHSKFNEHRRPSEAKLYKTKTLEGLRKGNAKALEWEDNIFKKGVFKKSFAQYCKANGLDLAKPVSDEFMEAATNYAHAQALKATYQDPNMLADAISKFKRKFEPNASDPIAVKVGKTIGHQVTESMLPFVKTPANILKRGFEYSPVGVAGGIAKIASAKTAEDLMKGIEYFSQGITGTGLIGLGLFLGHRGIVNGSMGEYDKEYAYRQMLGEQDYAVTVGDYTYTLDWMSPLAMPFFVGVEASNILDGSDDNTMWNVIESFTHLTEPLFEMSMLSGIETTFDTTFTSDSKVKTILENSMQGYISQFVPTVFGQLARTLTPERKVALSTAETKTERNLDKYIDKLENKIPGVTEWNEPYVDQWGRTDGKKTSGDYWLSAAENFLSPGYISKKNLTSVDKEISRLYDKIGETDGANIIPAVSSSSYKQKFEGKEYRMSESEFTDYKKTVGSYRHTELQKLFKTEEYKTASDADKAKMIKDVYDAGAEKGKEKFLVGSGKVAKEAYAYSTLNDSQKAAVDERQITAVKLRSLKDKAKESGVDGGSSGVSVALALGGEKLSDLKAFNDNVKEQHINSAKKLKALGYTVESYEAEKKLIKDKHDANNNGSIDKDEYKAYFKKQGYGYDQSAALYMAMTGRDKY